MDLIVIRYLNEFSTCKNESTGAAFLFLPPFRQNFHKSENVCHELHFQSSVVALWNFQVHADMWQRQVTAYDSLHGEILQCQITGL